jgi:hypothetical protein
MYWLGQLLTIAPGSTVGDVQVYPQKEEGNEE